MVSIDPELRLKPVVAFDVDGVVRVRKIEIDGLDQGELIGADITLKREEYPDLFHGKPRWDETGTSSRTEHFSRAAVDLIGDLSEDPRTEPVWATTWQRWANYYFSSALELPELPVAVKTLEPEELNYAHCSPSWKTQQLSRQFDGRPLIWLDDNMPDRPGEDLTELRRPIDRALTKSFRVNPWTGITPADVEEILGWIELASTEAGQQELRAQRQVELKEEKKTRARQDRQRGRQHEIFMAIRDRLLELYPEQRRFASEVASAGQYKDGLTAETLRYALKRNSIEADPTELAASLRVPRYHLRGVDETEDQDAGLDERYNF